MYAFVTGANRGLGRGFLDYLINQKYFVFAGTRNISSKEKGTDFLKWVKLDVSDDVSIEKAISLIRQKTNKLDLLVNNAGLNKDSATNNKKEGVCNLDQLDRKSLNTMFDVNAVSPLILIKNSLPLLSQTESFIINISSCRASYHDEFENTTGNYGYRASKIALNMLTFTSTWDLPKNVKIFAVHPGSVKSDMNLTGTDLPYDQAQKIMEITKKWNNDFNGKFLKYDGKFYPLW